MKSLVTAGLLAAALVLAACGGSSDADPAEVNVTDVNGMGDDDEALGLFGPDRDNPDKVLCDRLSERYPRNWWTLADFLGQDLMNTCLSIYQVAAVVGDCLVRPKGNCPGVDLRGVDLRGKSLDGLNVAGANLAGVDLREAKLGEANLTGANLAGANLERAFMTFAKLQRADLTNTNFSNAQMYGVNLSGAVIEGINVGGAELRDAIWADGRKCSLNSPRGQCS